MGCNSCCHSRKIREGLPSRLPLERVVVRQPLLRRATEWPFRTFAQQVVIRQPLLGRAAECPSREPVVERDVGEIEENKNDRKLTPECLASEQETGKEPGNISREGEEKEQLISSDHSSFVSGDNCTLEEDFNRLILQNVAGSGEIFRFRDLALRQGPWGRGDAKEQLSFLFHLCNTVALVNMYVNTPTGVGGASFREVMDMAEWIHRWNRGEYMSDNFTGMADSLGFANDLFGNLRRDVASGRVTKEEFVEAVSSYDDVVAILTRRARRDKANGGSDASSSQRVKALSSQTINRSKCSKDINEIRRAGSLENLEEIPPDLASFAETQM